MRLVSAARVDRWRTRGIGSLVLVTLSVFGGVPSFGDAALGSVIFEEGFESGDLSAWTKVVAPDPTAVAPFVQVIAPFDPLVINDPAPEIVVTYFDLDPGIDLNTFTLTIDGVDRTSGCVISAGEATCTPPPLAPGIRRLEARIADLDGNLGADFRSFVILLDEAPPTVTIQSPAPGSVLGELVVLVAGTVEDDDQVVRVDLNGLPATLDGMAFSGNVPLTAGPLEIVATATDRAGNVGSTMLGVTLDLAPPTLTVEAPAAGTETNDAAIRFVGTVADDTGVTTFTIGGVPVAVIDGGFDDTIALAEGANSVEVVASDVVGNETVRVIDVTRRTVPAITITAPLDGGTVDAATVDVTGTVTEGASVAVNGTAAAVVGGTFSATVPIVGGGNLLVAVATLGGGQASDKVMVIRDVDPPRVTVYEPPDGVVVTEPTVDISGLANDIVPGTVNAEQVTVTVGGVPAAVVHRGFFLGDVALVPGENTLTVEATDRAGNVASTSVTVTYDATPRPRIVVEAGDGQEAIIGGLLPQPLVARLLDASGDPVASRNVVFQVLDNNGFLDSTRRQLAVLTDAEGRASTGFTLGTRVGVGAHRVLASAAGFAGRAVFSATATPGAPAALHVDSGEQQEGVIGRALPNAFTTVVTDAGFNRLAAEPVRFRVVQGDGVFANGLGEQIVDSDGDGRARVDLILGPDPSVAGNVVEVDLPDAPAVPFVSFVATGRVAGDPAATRVSGLVLDNADVPVPGVTVSVHGTALTAETDARGYFQITGAPVGTFLLDVDGTTAQRPGTWPHLEFEMTTIAGRDNAMVRPIYLLPIDTARGLTVSDTEGGLLMLPELPGFALDVAPGSVTFPGGETSGVISATLVHGDKVPMVPNFGQQPTFIVTIQPSGATFDPPARLVLPNVDGLAPGEVTELYSFDHDLGAFVAIGPGTVSEDGLAVVSNPGVGLVKAGWHCGGNPASSGTPHDCPTCKICNGSRCVPGCPIGPEGPAFPSAPLFDVAPETKEVLGCNCTGDDPCRFNYRCEGGQCVSDEVTVDSVDGECLAAVGASTTFTAMSNKADRVKWSANGGSPAMGMGETFTTSFASRGTKTVTARCVNAENATIRVEESCAGIQAELVKEEVPIVPPGGDWGEYKPLDFKPTFTGCVDTKWCFRLEKLVYKFGFGVNTNIAGITFISGANDPQINAMNCEIAIPDLTPPVNNNQGPPRSMFAVPHITEIHEHFHKMEFDMVVVEPLFTMLDQYVRMPSNCTDCWSPLPTARVRFNAKLRMLWTSLQSNVFDGMYEQRAHAVSNPMYAAVVAGIRQRAQQLGWPVACQ